MAKRTVKLAFMANKSVRQSAYRNRRKTNMVKKLNEKVLTRVVQMAQVEQRRRLLNHERELQKKIEEAKEKVRKKKEEIRVKELTIRLHEYMKAGSIPDDLGVDEIKELEDVIDLKIKEIDKLIEEAEKAETSKSQATVVDGGAANKGKEPVDGNNGLEVLLNAMQMVN